LFQSEFESLSRQLRSKKKPSKCVSWWK
jgi:hypothetical protein